MQEVRIRDGYLSFTGRRSWTLSDSESSDDDFEQENVGIEIGWNWDRYARPSRGILKETEVDKKTAFKTKTTRQVRFNLTPAQEASTDKPYREKYGVARSAKREQLKANGQRFGKTLDMIFKRMQRNVDPSYLRTWNEILYAQKLVPKLDDGYGMDPRNYFDAREYVSCKVILESHNVPERFDLDQFAHKFRRLIFAPAKLTP